MELQRLYVRILGDIVDLEQKMSRAERLSADFGQKMQSVGKGLTIGLTLPLGAVGVAAVSAAADLDRLKRGLTAVMGSTGEATAELSRLEGVAKLPGLGFREAIRGSIRLQAAFGDMEGKADLARDALMAFGNAIATVGGGKAELDRVTIALSQIAAKGKVSAEEILQLQEALPQIRQAMKDAFGTASTEELQKMGITAEDFIRRITAAFQELEPVTGGAANTFENFTDALFRARAAVGDKLLPVITPMIEGLAEMLESVSDLNPATVQWGIAIGAVVAALGPALFLIGQLTVALAALSAAGASLALVFAVGAPLVVGLSALAALWLKNKLEAAGFREELEGINAAAQSYLQRVQTMTAAEVEAEGQRVMKQIEQLRLLIDIKRALGDPLKDILPLEIQLASAERQMRILQERSLQGFGGAPVAAPPAAATSLAPVVALANSGASAIADMFLPGLPHGKVTLPTPPAAMTTGDNTAFALSTLGNAFGGRTGNVLGGVGGIVAALGTGGVTGAIGAFGASLGVLEEIFGQTESSVERANRAFDEMASALSLRFAVLDIDDPGQQFDMLLEAFIAEFGGFGPLDDALEGLTPENFDERAARLLEVLDALGPLGVAGPFEELIKQLDALSDALGETTRTLNAPQGFKVAAARFLATDASGGFGTRGVGPRNTERGGVTITGPVTVVTPDVERFGKDLQRRIARGGMTSVQLALGGA